MRIEDFEPIPCTYARGPSYLLTDAERAYFDEVCRRRSTEIVGYYRSHTRDGLALHPEDIQLLDRHFSQPAQVALLVKPFATKPGVAGFFVKEQGRVPRCDAAGIPVPPLGDDWGRAAPACAHAGTETGREPKREQAPSEPREESVATSPATEPSPVLPHLFRWSLTSLPRKPPSTGRPGRSRGPGCGWWRASSS